MTSFDIGTIQIDNPKAEMIIKESSTEDIKKMFVTFLESDFIPTQKTIKKGKWWKFAERMSWLTNPKITEHIIKTSQDMRSGFELRDLNITK